MKFWAHHPNGVVCEPLIELPDDAVPGETVFRPEIAVDMSDVTALSPRPDVGWTTSDGGKTFEAPATPDPVTVVPVSVSSAQAKIQCLRTPGSADGKTLLDDIKDAVAKAGGETQIWFTDARTWERSNSYVASLSKSLKLKPADVDQLFIAAAQIAA